MARSAPDWPPWWEWELDLWSHLRRMMEYANGYRRARREGRWIITTKHRGKDWEIVVQPDPDTKYLGVVTAYEVTPKSR